MPNSKIPTYAFGFSLLLALIYIWLPEWFLTGDGPSHAYNAVVLSDLLQGKNLGVYSPFFEINTQPEPNWMGHILLALLQFVVSAPVAEKILLSAYVLLFVLGFRRFLRMVSPNNEWLSVVAVLLVFNHPIQMGFYNSGLSVALLWWVLSLWIFWVRTQNWTGFLGLLLGCSLVFFTHMTGYMYLLLAMGWMGLFFLTEKRSFKDKLSVVVGSLVVHVLPLFWSFKYVSNNSHDLRFDTSEIWMRMLKLIRLETLITLHHTEIYPAIGVGIFVFSIAILALIRFYYGKKMISRMSLSLFPILFCVFLVYFLLPDWMASGGLFNIRTQYITALFLIAFASLATWAHTQVKTISILSFIFMFWLTAVRIPVILRASSAVSDYLSVGDFIAPGSTVLPLSFHHNGILENGRLVADRIWLFMHAADYLGTQKPLVMLGNYEANSGYFPLNWKEGKNTFASLSYENGIEGQPPNVNIEHYTEKTGLQVDYVLLWCENNEPWRTRQSPLKEHLASEYKLVAISPKGWAQLYKRNKSSISLRK